MLLCKGAGAQIKFRLIIHRAADDFAHPAAGLYKRRQCLIQRINSYIYNLPVHDYQMLTLSSGDLYIPSPGTTPDAS